MRNPKFYRGLFHFFFTLFFIVGAVTMNYLIKSHANFNIHELVAFRLGFIIMSILSMLAFFGCMEFKEDDILLQNEQELLKELDEDK